MTNKTSSLSRKLAAYSMATGTSILAIDTADAAVVRFSPDPPIVIDSSFGYLTAPLDLNGDGVVDFEIVGSCCYGSEYLGGFSIASINFQNLIGPADQYLGAFVLSPGEQIGTSVAGWLRNTTLEMFRQTRGFVGVRFDIPGGSPHFGYLDVEFGGSLDRFLTLHAWAYESLANTPIIAGAVPEPTGLALLASGTAGLAFWRRRES